MIYYAHAGTKDNTERGAGGWGGELFKLNVEKRKSFTWHNRKDRQINALKKSTSLCLHRAGVETST